MASSKKYQKVALIVGAGASKGAFLSGARTPPLDSEFLATAKELFDKGGRTSNNLLISEGKEVWREFKRNLKNIGLEQKSLVDWRLETLTTYLEARANVNFENKAGRPALYRNALDRLNRVICYVLSLSGGDKTCRVHKEMINFFSPKAVISFNYDLILDQTLLGLGKLNWAASTYSKGKTVEVWTGKKRSNRTWYKKRRRSTSGVTLYKLHGSIHWQRLQRGGPYIVSGVRTFPFKDGHPMEYAKPPKTPLIVPPVAAKMQIADLGSLWTAAHKELKASSTWVIWGYSFPQTDTITSVLLKTCVKDARGKKKRVIIINPDSTVSERVKALLGKVNVEHYGSATDFLLKVGRLHVTATQKPKKRAKTNTAKRG